MPKYDRELRAYQLSTHPDSAFCRCITDADQCFACVEQHHYVQMKRLYSVHIFVDDHSYPLTYEVYYQKTGYPMMYAFGIPVQGRHIAYAFDIAWGNIHHYKGDFK